MRLGRTAFWRFLTANFLLVGIAQFAVFKSLHLLHVRDVYVLAWILNPVLIGLLYLPSAVMAGRRLHDIGRSSWPILLFYLLIVGRLYLLLAGMLLSFLFGSLLPRWLQSVALFGPILICLLGIGGWLAFLCAQPGDQEANRYGPVPS